MLELQQLRTWGAGFALLMVHLGAVSLEASTPTPPLLEPNQPLTFMERVGFDAAVFHSLESIG